MKFPSSILPKYLEDKLKKNKIPFVIKNLNSSNEFKEFDFFSDNFESEDLYTIFICQLIKIIITTSNIKQSSPSIINTMISKVVKYVDDNIKSPLSLSKISKACHYSKSYISNGFKEYMKTPIMKYVRYKKMIAAHAMIMAGEKKRVVANLFGYDDYSTFYRSYKKTIRDDKGKD